VYLKIGDFILGLKRGIREEIAIPSIKQIKTQKAFGEETQEKGRSSI